MWLVLASAIVVPCPQPTIAVDLSRLDGMPDRELGELHQALLVRLMEERLAVIGDSDAYPGGGAGDPAELALRLVPVDAATIRVEVVLAGRAREAVVALPAGDATGRQLALVQAAIELVRAALRDREPCTAPAPAPAPPVPVPVPVPVRALEPARALTMRLGVAGLARATAIAPGAGVELELVPGSRIHLAAAALVAAPVDVPSTLSIVELGAAVGVAVVLPVAGGRLRWTGAALVGAWYHHYAYSSDGGGGDSGDRLDPAALVRVGLEVPLGTRLAVELDLGILAIARDRRHVEDGAMIYQARRLRPLAGLTMAYTF